jgi:hypothetical protein
VPGRLVTLTAFPKRTFPLRPGYHVRFFIRRRQEADSLLAGISSRRLAQVATRLGFFRVARVDRATPPL